MKKKLVAMTKNVMRVLAVPEYFFVVAASFFGLLFLLLIPPFQTPDEIVHFYRAYEVSEFSANRVEKNNVMGSMLPASIGKTLESVNAQPDVTTHIQFNPYNKYHLRYTKNALKTPLNQNDKSFYETDTFPSFVYLPQAVAVTVGKIFSAPIIVMLYMVRLMNLAIWIAVVFFCIRNFPWKKWALVGACLLPVVVAQTVSPGLDVLALSSTLVFLTLVFNGIADRHYTFTIKNLALLVIAGVIMIYTKSTLAIFFPLLLLIKGDQIALRFKTITKLAAILLPIIAYIALPLMTAGAHDQVQDPAVSQQMSILVHHPLHFVHLLFNTTFFVTNAGNALAQSTIGVFGWLDTPLSQPFIYLGVAYVAFLLLVGISKGKDKITRRTRFVMLVAALGFAAITFLAMYLYSTLPRDNNIKGVQGRYLIPVLFMMIPILLNSHIIASKLFYMRVVQTLSISMLVISVLTIIARYYFVYIPS